MRVGSRCQSTRTRGQAVRIRRGKLHGVARGDWALNDSMQVRVVYTKNAWYFHQNSAEIYNMGIYKEYMQLIDTFRIACYLDEDEWAFRKVREDTVLHIQLRKWADLTLIAPLSANTLAKLANGICDNLLTSFARAWDIRKPFVVAPAMNTFMWEHPFTGNQLKVLETLNIKIISPVSKVLACGDTGKFEISPTVSSNFITLQRKRGIGRSAYNSKHGT